MAAAAVRAAGMPLAMVVAVVAALNIRIKAQLPSQIVEYRLIGIALHTAEQLDPGLCQRHLGPAADAAADEDIHTVCPQKSSQRAVAVSICIDYFGMGHCTIRHIVELKVLRMAKVLEHRSVFVSDCNSHNLDLLLIIIALYARAHINNK